MPVRSRIILRPASSAFAPVQPPEAVPSESRARVLRIHQAAEYPFRALLPVRGQRYVIVRLHTDIDSDRRLERKQRSYKGNTQAEPPPRFPQLDFPREF